MRRKDHHVLLQSVAIGAACLLLLVSVASYYMRYLNDNITAEIKTNLSEVSRKNTDSIRKGMCSNLNQLETIAEYIQYENLDDHASIVNRLRTISDKNGLKRMAIVDLHGDADTTDNKTVNVADRSYFKNALQGKSSISSVLSDKIDHNKKINVYAAPIMRGDKVEAVIYSVKGTNDVAKDLLISSFNGSGYSMLVDATGEVVLRAKDQNTDNDFHNLNELNYEDSDSDEKDDNATSGIATYYDEHGEKYFMAYETLGINKWSVVSVVPASVVSSQIASFMQMAVFTWVIIILVFMVLLLYIYLSWHRNNRKMQKVLFKDALTGYDNFNRFKMDVDQILNDKKHGPLGTLIELDIEDFKMFNKIHGYEIGDELLKYIMRCINLYCGINERCARISDDRFVIYWEETDENQLTKRINQMYSNIIMIFESETKYTDVKFHLCFGVYIIEPQERNLMRSLDKAIYAKNHIKQKHDVYISFYNAEMYQQVLKEKYMLERLDKALENGEFVVYLQPKVDVNTFQIVAAEALVRWRDPAKGLVPPNEFIPLFERTGDLYKIDYYVFNKVCRMLHRWQNEHRKMITISVNLSKSYIFSKGFAQHLFDILQANHLSPEYLELEITESTMLENPKDLVAVVEELKSFGFKISMDDFGSGYSSLNMLKEVPIDVIKLDQVFFHHSKENQRKSNLIVAGLCQLIDMLHIETVAEGIETMEQLKFLQRVKCHIAQGFYFYRPMPIPELEHILNDEEESIQKDENK